MVLRENALWKTAADRAEARQPQKALPVRIVESKLPVHKEDWKSSIGPDDEALPSVLRRGALQNIHARHL
jgi:hypothetical protein